MLVIQMPGIVKVKEGGVQNLSPINGQLGGEIREGLWQTAIRQ